MGRLARTSVGVLFVAVAAGCASASPAIKTAPPTTARAADGAAPIPTSIPAYMVQVPEVSHPAVSLAAQATGPLPDGDYVGYLRSIDMTTGVLIFDPAQWLSGPAGLRAAVADGYIKPGQNLPNDYYLRPASSQLRSVPLATQVTVTVARCPTVCATYAGSLPELAVALAHPVPTADYAAPYRSAGTYWIKLSGGRVTRIDEQYRP